MSETPINPIESETEPETLADIEPLYRTLLRAKGNPAKQDWGRTIFLVGAGCSQSAGIPMAGGVVEMCMPILFESYSQNKNKRKKKPEAAFKWLCDNGHLSKSWWSKEPNWADFYGELFEKHFQSDGEQREIILKAIEQGGNKINWAHLCLGELVSRGFVHTVLTTNFDQLVLRGIINTGVIPVVADGLEALSRVISNPKTPQVVHLHGSMHTYTLRNSRTATEETKGSFDLGGMMHGLLQNCDALVVIGYSGGKEGVMERLIEAARSFPNLVIYWIMYEENYKKLSEKATELLAIGHNKFLMTGYDADKFFIELMERLNIGVPEWMKNPVEILIDESKLIAPPEDEDITKKIEEYKNKLSHLNNSLSETTDESNNNLAEIFTLSIEGEFEKAFLKLKDISKGTDYKLWKMQAEIAFDAGRQISNLDYLEESKNSWEESIKLAQDNPIALYKAQLGLAKTLQLLYELEDSKEYIEQSVEAYRAALGVEEFKENSFENWAETQNDLGVALQAIYESDANLIDEAISAFRNALQQFTQEKDPTNWAETKSNLGEALQRLGELNGDTDLMEQAKTEFESALEVYTRERFPKDWAETQMNLGSVLQKMGETKKNVSLLERAGKAYRRALEEYNSKKSENWLWAMSSLGKVLQTLADLQPSIASFREAEGIYQEILNVYDNNVDSTEEPFKSIEEGVKTVRRKIGELEK